MKAMAANKTPPKSSAEFPEEPNGDSPVWGRTGGAGVRVGSKGEVAVGVLNGGGIIGVEVGVGVSTEEVGVGESSVVAVGVAVDVDVDSWVWVGVKVGVTEGVTGVLVGVGVIPRRSAALALWTRLNAPNSTSIAASRYLRVRSDVIDLPPCLSASERDEIFIAALECTGRIAKECISI